MASPRTRRQLHRLLAVMAVACAVVPVFNVLTSEASLRSALQGLVDAVLLTLLVGGYLLFVRDGLARTWFRRLGFWSDLALSSTIVLVLFLLGRGVGQVATTLDPGRLASSFGDRHLLYALPFFAVLSVAIQFVVQMNRMIGANVLGYFMAGVYRHPAAEERVFLFLDLAGSTQLAERPGAWAAGIDPALGPDGGAGKAQRAARAARPGQRCNAACAPIRAQPEGPGSPRALAGVAPLARAMSPRCAARLRQHPWQPRRGRRFLPSTLQGSARYFELLRRFVDDLTEPVLDTQGEIYQYAGDEVVITWPLAAGVRDANCVRCFFAVAAAIARSAPRYEHDFGVVPRFRGGLHGGRVTAGELGDLRQQIVFVGDILNTAARLEEHAKREGLELVASEAIVARVALPAALAARPCGALALRGKERRVAACSVTSLA